MISFFFFFFAQLEKQKDKLQCLHFVGCCEGIRGRLIAIKASCCYILSHVWVTLYFIRFCCFCQVKDVGLLDDGNKEEEEPPEQKNEESLIGTVETI